jgi:hypothetical protein
MKFDLHGGSLETSHDAEFVYIDVDIGGKTTVIKMSREDASRFVQSLNAQIYPQVSPGKFRGPNPFYDEKLPPLF